MFRRLTGQEARLKYKIYAAITNSQTENRQKNGNNRRRNSSWAFLAFLGFCWLAAAAAAVCISSSRQPAKQHTTMCWAFARRTFYINQTRTDAKDAGWRCWMKMRTICGRQHCAFRLCVCLRCEYSVPNAIKIVLMDHGMMGVLIAIDGMILI